MYPSLKKKIFHIRVSTCVCTILCLTAVIQFFAAYGKYNYKHLPAEVIEIQLYQQRSPKLVLKKDKPDCKYSEILKNELSINPCDIPKKFASFNANGIVNGSYVPDDCNPTFSVAIIVPYRNKQKQLDIFLPYMHDFLRKQKIHYKVYLIEQQDEKAWNKGIMLNTGAKQAINDKFPCLILHDVDLLPLDASNLYACTNEPRHLSASLDKFRYVLAYDYLVTGVLAIRADHYVTVNGFSNKFEDYGGEDYDFSNRLAAHNRDIVRFPQHMSRYTMMVHPQQTRNSLRYKIMSQNKYNGGNENDGLSSLPYLDTSIHNHRLFTLIGVKL